MKIIVKLNKPIHGNKLKSLFYKVIRTVPRESIIKMYGTEINSGHRYLIMECIADENMWYHENDWVFERITCKTKQK